MLVRLFVSRIMQ